MNLKKPSPSEASLQRLKDKKTEFSSAQDYYNFLSKEPSLKSAVFAGGCFWCIEGPFEAEQGVIEAFSGYSGGHLENPSYQQVSSGSSGARETAIVFYDPSVISYNRLLEIYWRQIDPTDKGGQYADRGHHYTTAIYYQDQEQQKEALRSKQALENSGHFSNIATEVLPMEKFTLAEAYHQDYYLKSSEHYQRYKMGSGRASGIKENASALDDIFHKQAMESYSKPSAHEIKAMLSKEAYAVTQGGSTERPFANAYWDNKKPGIYVDVVTGEPLFSSTDKFDSGTGWPSFSQPIDHNFITTHQDNKLAVMRTEVKSKVGDSHLGHVFNDGPREKGGMRYCINSSALRFVPLEVMEEEGYGNYLSLFK